VRRDKAVLVRQAVPDARACTLCWTPQSKLCTISGGQASVPSREPTFLHHSKTFESDVTCGAELKTYAIYLSQANLGNICFSTARYFSSDYSDLMI